jgi:hypothetical protein
LGLFRERHGPCIHRPPVRRVSKWHRSQRNAMRNWRPRRRMDSRDGT